MQDAGSPAFIKRGCYEAWLPVAYGRETRNSLKANLPNQINLANLANLANLVNLANLTNLATCRHAGKLKIDTDTH